MNIASRGWVGVLVACAIALIVGLVVSWIVGAAGAPPVIATVVWILVAVVIIILVVQLLLSMTGGGRGINGGRGTGRGV